MLTAASGIFIYPFAALAAIKARVRPVLGVLAFLFSVGVMVGSGVEATLLSVLLMLVVLPLYALARRKERRLELEAVADRSMKPA